MEQMQMFGTERYRVKTPIRLIELFAGVGSQAMALRDIGAEFEHYRVVEFDKYAVKSYNAIHGTNFPVTDIRDIHGEDLGIVDKDKYTYLMTYSFPCTDLSVAGKMQGMTEGSGTRSSLLWEVKRLLAECEELPQLLLMENVPQVHGKKNIEEFNRWNEFLKTLGYTTVWKDMNAKDYGVAQSRNRCFALSMLGNYSYEFPEGYKLTKTVRDYLEDEVDEKYYIKSERAKKLIDKLIENGKLPLQTDRQTDRQTGTMQARQTLHGRWIHFYSGCRSSGFREGCSRNHSCEVLQRAWREWRQRDNADRSCRIFGGGRQQSASQPVIRMKSKSQTAYPQEQTEEYLQEQMMEAESSMLPSYLNLTRIDTVNVDTARTIMARDYKGFGTSTETQNGVVEWTKLK